MIQQPAVAIGIFAERDQARAAIEDLRAAGYGENQVGLLTRARTEEGPDEAEAAGADVTTGAATGGFIGGLLGAVAALFIPGIGPALAGGILAATLGGAAIGATAGGLISIFRSLGATEDEARYYQQELEQGRIIVTVKTESGYDEALAIMRRHGAYNAELRRDVYTPTTLARGSREREPQPPIHEEPPDTGTLQ